MAFSRIQDLSYYSQLLRNAISQLTSNVETLDGLRLLLPVVSYPLDIVTAQRLSTLKSQFGMDLEWAKGLYETTKETSSLVCSYHATCDTTSQLTIFFTCLHR